MSQTIDSKGKINTKQLPKGTPRDNKAKLDKVDWKRTFLSENPEIAELRERIIPLERTLQFGKTYLPLKKDTPPPISKQELIQLVLGHFYHEGLTKSQEALEKAAMTKLDPQQFDFNDSRLTTLIRIGVKETEKIYDLSINDKRQTSEDTLNDLTEHLYNFGMLEADKDLNDINVWEEPTVVDDNITFVIEKSGQKSLKGATLNKLIERLVPIKENDLDFQAAFILTFQSFTTSENLIQKLIERYQVPPQPKMTDKEFKAFASQIHLRTVSILKKVIALHFDDLNDQHLQSIKSFLENYVKADSPNLYQQCQKAIQKKLQNSEENDFNSEKSQSATFGTQPPEPKISEPKILCYPNLNILILHEIEIARQLTLLEFELFSKIHPSQLLDQKWMKAKTRHRSQDLLNFINRSTLISTWISAQILQEVKLKNRVYLYSKFIKVAENLKKLNNFSTLFAVMAGLNNAAVHRLAFTREEVGKPLLSSYDFLMKTISSSKGFHEYRELVSTVEPPCIPYMGVYLTDLAFTEENSDFTTSNSGKTLINFHKRNLTYRIINKIQQFQQAQFNLVPIYQIQQLFTLDRLKQCQPNEKELWELSLEREPKGMEKQNLL